jgi:ADP-heptose:LPS heptosyltransferase
MMLYLLKNKPHSNQKKICIIRYGAWGDAIMLSPVFKYYKADGYHVTLNCTQKCFDILNTNPHIDAFLLQEDNEIPLEKLNEHWDTLRKVYDRVVNFSGSIENTLLIAPNQAEWTLPKEELHKRCNKNYYDHTLEVAGYKKKKGEKGELYFTPKEEKWAKRLNLTGYTVVWCLSGSSIHKIYPYADTVIKAILDGIPEAHVILVGEPGAKGIIDPHPRLSDWCGRIDIRKSFLLTKYADLVISPETSVLVAAGCFDTPKIALLSHGSEENVSKYYENCVVVRQDVKCSPCHKLHYKRNSCPVVKETDFPVCMGLLHPKKLLPPIEKFYLEWRKNHGNSYTAD